MKYLKYILPGLITVLAILFIAFSPKAKEDYNYHIYRSKVELHYYSLKDSLVNVVDKYIQTVAPGSALNGIVLVDQSDEYNLDLRFMLAQGQIESAFGTKGVARKTNSVFNVHSYDGLSAEQIIKKGKGYSHPDHSVEPYCKLLTEKYLGDKFTEYDLMVKFESLSGHRYATDKSYESKLLSKYNSICSMECFEVYDEYLKYKLLLK
jgi:hypothetical protein